MFCFKAHRFLSWPRRFLFQRLLAQAPNDLSRGLAWLIGAAASANPWSVLMFALMLGLFGVGAALIFINSLALHQSVAPAAPGALLGGWLGEHFSLRTALLFAGGATVLIAAVAWRS